MTSQGGATLTAVNGGATGLLKDIQRRLSSGILPGLKHDLPSVMVNSNTSATSPVVSKKTYRLKNIASKAEIFDTLHNQFGVPTSCGPAMCQGSVVGSNPLFISPPRSKDDVLSHAKDFFDQYFTSMRRPNSAAHKKRWECVQRSIKDTGRYELTETELTFGAKLAWRNSVRCIGRIQWSKLQVFDCRQVTTTSGMFEAICNHIKYSTNKGNIRSAITIFPQRTDGKHDFRIWNPQLIAYAGYKNTDGAVTGDPQNVEFTEVCKKLGWNGKGTQFDILPLVLSANGHDPDYFDIPPELILEISFTHPLYPWFKELNLKWYALPAVSNMALDCGGLQFTAAPFNGWYMSTEIGCRDLGDSFRYNVLEKVALKMGLDTRSASTLWKDRAVVEVNVAVLHSFQQMNVTIVDHHTASESFMKHYENEQKLRNGCPADWVWIVPPMSGSCTPVFHQEMAVYHLKPSYDYQDSAWKTHSWEKIREKSRDPTKPRRKFHFKQLARAVKFTSKLFGKALSKRIKATILFATETGKSETFAKRLLDIFGHAFNAQLYSMADYDISNIEHEALVLVIASTFGNGDPPENGLEFAQNLYKMKMDGVNPCDGDDQDDKFNMASSKSFIKLNSQVEPTTTGRRLDRLESLRGSVSDVMAEDNFGPLSNVRFAVFGLGSSAYPNFAAFGKYVDNLLHELGGERLMKLAVGDEMFAQEQAFAKWAPEVFKLASEAFCLDAEDTINGYDNVVNLSEKTVRFAETSTQEALEIALSNSTNRRVSVAELISNRDLHQDRDNGSTLSLQIKSDLPYQPGDHVGVFPCNRSEIVDGIIQRLDGVPSDDVIVQLQLLKETPTTTGIVEKWEAHERLPACSFRTLLTRYLDITTPPSPNVLEYLSNCVSDQRQQERLKELTSESHSYDDWRYGKYPNLLETLQEFSTAKPKAALLVAQLSQLQPRFYSISSSPLAHPGQIHLTVAVVRYTVDHGSGPLHYGVCSNYLNDCKAGDNLYMFVRSAPNFHLPLNLEKPLVLVGPGTGIAPFRGFWWHRCRQLEELDPDSKVGGVWLFFGSRNNNLDLYRDEKKDMTERKVLERTFLALSREPKIKKTYVQDLMRTEKPEIYKKIVIQKGHFYVCGDCKMADNVHTTLKQIIQELGQMSDTEVDKYLLSMRDENRYHEDIFGITLRTAEVHHKSRNSARQRLSSQT